MKDVLKALDVHSFIQCVRCGKVLDVEHIEPTLEESRG